MASIRLNSIILNEKEVPHLITALYNQLNKPAKCAYCGKLTKLIRIEFVGTKIKKVNKACRKCELSLIRAEYNKHGLKM